MDWQQKAAALSALVEIQLICRKAGDWYVRQEVEIKDGAILRGSYGNGTTPQEAVEDHWRQLVDEMTPTPMYLVVSAGGGQRKRRAVRWNGFMWMDVSE
jgi:hypothetical protein